MSDFVVESMGSGDGMHVVYSSAQMGCFIIFALVCALSAMSEMTHARLHGRIGSGRHKGKGHLLLKSTTSGLVGSEDPIDMSSAPVMETTGPLFDVRRISQLAPVRIAMGDRAALLASRNTLRAWAEFGLVLGLFYFADRTGAIADSEIFYDRDLFLALFFGLAAYGWRTSLHKSKTHAPLNREQTEEWKGWMQVIFLLYHYFKASELYNAIRLFIAAYVWMTGFGNFSYYYGRKDYSAPRFWQMMWRLNFFVFFTCIVMGNGYTLYYICPMHTLFTLFVYFSLLIYKDHNYKATVIVTKVLVCTFLVFLIWEVPVVFDVVFHPLTFLLKYTDPKKPDNDPMHEWFFRSGLDRYVWIYGMVCAFVYPQYKSFLNSIDKKSAPMKVVIQTTIAGATLLVLYWYHEKYYILPKVDYNKIHPYTSWIPITCFIILRNLTQTLRNFYTELFCVCGKITLETYISQFHVWLSTSNVSNGQPGKLMNLVPGYPLINFGLTTIAYVGISLRVFAVTNVLKTACVPNDIQKIKAHAALGVIISFAAKAAGFVVVHVFMSSRAVDVPYDFAEVRD